MVKPAARRFYHAKRYVSDPTARPPTPVPLQQEKKLQVGNGWLFARAEGVRSSWLSAVDRWGLLTGDTKAVEDEMWPRLAHAFSSEEQREHIATHMERLVYGFYPQGLQGAALWLIYARRCNGDPLQFARSIDSPTKQTHCRKWLESLCVPTVASG